MLFYTLHLQASANNRFKNNFVLLTVLSAYTWFHVSVSAHVSLWQFIIQRYPNLYHNNRNACRLSYVNNVAHDISLAYLNSYGNWRSHMYALGM